MDRDGHGGGALGIDGRRRAADETPGLADNVAPQRRSQRGIVDLADEFRELLCLIHGHLRRRALERRSSTSLPPNYLEPPVYCRTASPDSVTAPLPLTMAAWVCRRTDWPSRARKRPRPE